MSTDTTTPGSLRPYTAWMFVWTVELPLAGRPRQSNVFSFKGHEVYLRFLKDTRYGVELQGQPSFFSCGTSEMTVRVETRNKTLLPLPNNLGIEPGYKIFWSYGKAEILAAYPDFLRDGFLTFLVCDVDPPEGEKHPRHTSLDLTGLSADFENLLTSGEASDVQLKCGTVTRSAHRAVLAARSEVFTAMFRNKMAESTSGVVDITDVDETLLDFFLKYVYTGILTDLPVDEIRDLYALGDRYAVHSLKKMCSNGMVANLSADNYQTFLMTAEAHSDAELKAVLIQSVADHSEWLDCETWMEFSKEHPTLANEVYHKYYVKTRNK